MKINEASVIDNKVIDDAIRTLIADGNHVLAQELKSQLKPLEPIVRDAYQQGMIDALTNTQTKPRYEKRKIPSNRRSYT